MARRKQKGHWSGIFTGPLKMAVGAGIWSIGKMIDRPDVRKTYMSSVTIKTTRRVKNADGSVTVTTVTKRTRR